ncbi:MAG: ATP-binding cassette domain-containing protein [Alphaproteobacteria bacterium]|jgi:ABC-2 type transport system ATP-binding protein|nr:ATP-binding cassette domain-containing protein [Alphaproteobacteria bacterium]
MDVLLDVEGLTKQFGALTAVDDVSFRVRRGEVVGFLGPNGAGKSTTMRMITGYLPADAGRAELCGVDVQREPERARAKLGYLPEGAPAYGEMTPLGLLTFVAQVRGLSGREREQRLREVRERLRLDSVWRRPIEALSKGFKRRVGVAQAILHDPELLVLDEPTDGLDPNQKFEVRRFLKDIAADKAILVSTHILEEVDAICDRAIIVANGRIVADGTPSSLEARAVDHNVVAVTLPADAHERALAALEDAEGVAEVRAANDEGGEGEIVLLVRPAHGTDVLARVHEASRAADLPVREITRRRGRLDDIFRTLTSAA